MPLNCSTSKHSSLLSVLTVSTSSPSPYICAKHFLFRSTIKKLFDKSWALGRFREFMWTVGGQP